MKFDELIEKHKQMMQELRTNAREAFKEMMQEIFTKVPGLVEIRWSQYTPYFNDGDPCYFSVHDPSFIFEDDQDDDNDWWDEKGKSVWQLREHAQHEIISTVAAKLRDEAGEQMLLAIFGDHQRVSVKAKHIVEVMLYSEEYEHD